LFILSKIPHTGIYPGNRAREPLGGRGLPVVSLAQKKERQKKELVKRVVKSGI